MSRPREPTVPPGCGCLLEECELKIRDVPARGRDVGRPPWRVARGAVLSRGWQPALMPPGGNKMCTGRRQTGSGSLGIPHQKTKRADAGGACDRSQAPADARIGWERYS